MAKRKINKSEAVREYLAENPEAKPKAISEALAAKGIKVTPGAVSTIKFQATRKNGAPKSKRVSRPAKARRTVGGAAANRLKQLMATKDLVDQVGGVDQQRSCWTLLRS